jgi:hypothetical protein
VSFSIYRHIQNFIKMPLNRNRHIQPAASVPLNGDWHIQVIVEVPGDFSFKPPGLIEQLD